VPGWWIWPRPGKSRLWTVAKSIRWRSYIIKIY
jgi:hypothetical protein